LDGAGVIIRRRGGGNRGGRFWLGKVFLQAQGRGEVILLKEHGSQEGNLEGKKSRRSSGLVEKKEAVLKRQLLRGRRFQKGGKLSGIVKEGSVGVTE